MIGKGGFSLLYVMGSRDNLNNIKMNKWINKNTFALSFRSEGNRIGTFILMFLKQCIPLILTNDGKWK